MKGGCNVEDRYLSFYKTVGSRIREIRLSKNMSQADLAEKAGLSLPTVSDIENAHSKIWLTTFARIAEALQVSADDILRLDTPAATDSYPEEFAQILKGCSTSDIASILEIVKQIKTTLDSKKKIHMIKSRLEEACFFLKLKLCVYVPDPQFIPSYLHLLYNSEHPKSHEGVYVPWKILMFFQPWKQSPRFWRPVL